MMVIASLNPMPTDYWLTIGWRTGEDGVEYFDKTMLNGAIWPIELVESI